MLEDDLIRPAHARFSRPFASARGWLTSVYTLFQDSVGFIWVGMQQGLARLDAHDVRRFEHDADDPRSIPGRFVPEPSCVTNFIVAGS